MYMRCAVDHVAFMKLATYDTEINYCPKCGIWIDREDVWQSERTRSAVLSRTPDASPRPAWFRETAATSTSSSGFAS
jgi:Zn-finger nucleic acid-binding protein